jgi:mono/diheme cytochrome c family protein
MSGWVLFLAMGLYLGSVTNSTAQETERGAKLFHQYCASCHGEKANGNGPIAPYLTVKPSDLTTITERQLGKFPEDQIVRIIAGEENPPGHGTRTMPVWGERLQDDVVGGASKPAVARGRIAFLVDYLKSIQDAKRQPFENIVTPTGGLRPEDRPRQ